MHKQGLSPPRWRIFWRNSERWGGVISDPDLLLKKGRGECQRPLRVCPKIHPLWRGQASISYKSGHQVAPLALLANLATSWRHMHKLQIWLQLRVTSLLMTLKDHLKLFFKLSDFTSLFCTQFLFKGISSLFREACWIRVVIKQK